VVAVLAAVVLAAVVLTTVVLGRLDEHLFLLLVVMFSLALDDDLHATLTALVEEGIVPETSLVASLVEEGVVSETALIASLVEEGVVSETALLLLLLRKLLLLLRKLLLLLEGTTSRLEAGVDLDGSAGLRHVVEWNFRFKAASVLQLVKSHGSLGNERV